MGATLNTSAPRACPLSSQLGRIHVVLASAMAMALVGGQAHAQMAPPRIIETIDVQVLRATNVVLGRVTGVESRGAETEVSIRPEQTLKGNQADSLRRTLGPADSAARRDVAAMRDSKVRILAVGQVLLPLDARTLMVPTASGVLLRDPGATISYVSDVLRTFPGGTAVPTFQQAVPSAWGDLYSRPYPASSMTVPVGPHLKRWAISAFTAGTDVDVAARALRLFRSEETTGELMSFLDTATFTVSKPPETNFGIEVRTFPVRKAAYEILTAWGVAIAQPSLTEEVDRLEDVERIVWLRDRPPDDQDLARLLGARRLERLEFPGTIAGSPDVALGLVTDAQMSAIGRLANLEALTVRGRLITDAGLSQILGLTNLEELDLSLTRVTERGLARLAGLPKLKRLILAGTALSDTGLAMLAGFPRLEYVGAMLTRITEEGVAGAERSRLGLRINRNFDVDLGFNITMTESLAFAAGGNARDIESIRVLLGGRYSDPNRPDLTRTPPVFYAVTIKNTDALEVFLERGARVNVTDAAGTTPLHWAARYGRIGAMKLLLERQADVLAIDDEGNTPLHFAAQQDDPEPVKMLLAAGAAPATMNRAGLTALDIAKSRGHDAVAGVLTRPR